MSVLGVRARVAAVMVVAVAAAGGLSPACGTPPPLGAEAGSGSGGINGGGGGGGGGGTVTASSGPVDTPAIRQELLARWNAAADEAFTAFDFHWAAFEQFPHPTTKGGSAEAYGAFARVLLAFFQRGDDFRFLTTNRLFTLHLVYLFPNGQSGLDTNFQMLARYFSARDSHGDTPAATRDALREFADSIDAGP